MDHGTKELIKLLKKFENMTIEEYKKLYEEVKENDRLCSSICELQRGFS